MPLRAVIFLFTIFVFAMPLPSRGEQVDSTRTTAPDSIASWRRPLPSASGERRDERLGMVRAQIATESWSREPVTDPRVLDAMRAVPRHVFVPEKLQSHAYDDTPLPIGMGQTISQPYIVAVMTELLAIEAGDRVLEIGTGSGYQAAVLGQLTSEVYSIEIIGELHERAAADLAGQGYDALELRNSDGYHGWPEAAPFDAIIVTCAAGHLPPALWEQLAPGGRIVIPLGDPYAVQRLAVIEKTADGKRRSETVMGVRFVPMTGRAESP